MPGRAPGTISRELRRNANGDGRYFSGVAQTKANVRRRAHIRRAKTGSVRLMAHVAERLGRRWSPQQIPGRVSIEERPEVVEARERIGDWEGDTLVGKGRSGYVATCVERASRYLVARKLVGCPAAETNAALHDGMRRLPAEKRQTLTVDNGREFAWHGRLAKLLRCELYFAHPCTAWERGSCENSNPGAPGLRQYLPKAIPFSELTDWRLESYLAAACPPPAGAGGCSCPGQPAAKVPQLPDSGRGFPATSRCIYDVNLL